MSPKTEASERYRVKVLGVEDYQALVACRDACPVHVITIAGKETPAVIEDKDCIRCYCCHEMCPHDAIELHSGFLYRIFNRS